MNNPLWSKMICVFHCIDFFLAIKSHPTCKLFFQGFIYESNEIQLHKQLHIQDNFILECEIIHFIHKCMFNAWCNEKCIITQSEFEPISHESIIHGHIVMLHAQNKVKKVLLKHQLWWHAWYNWNLPCYDANPN